MKNIAVILAGGIGARVGGTTPKQLLPLADGRSILEHSVEAFEQAACIDEIGIVIHKDYLAQAQEMVHRNAWQKVAFVIAGGNERYESSLNAIREIERRENEIEKENKDIERREHEIKKRNIECRENDINSDRDKSEQTTDSRPVINILLHDAARPFVSERIITDVCTALQQHEAVTVAIPATDTMYRVALQEQNATGDLVVQDIPPRSTLLCAQTPQAFRLTTIAEAYRLATIVETNHLAIAETNHLAIAETNHIALPVPNQLLATTLSDCPHLPATDDCGIVHHYLPHIPIHIVPGDAQNRKITYKEDL